MSPSSPERSAAKAAQAFLARVRPNVHRLQAEVLSRQGMPLLCAVEDALRQASVGPAAQELVWLSGAPTAQAHVLRLRAYDVEGELLAEAQHAFEA